MTAQEFAKLMGLRLTPLQIELLEKLERGEKLPPVPLGAGKTTVENLRKQYRGNSFKGVIVDEIMD